MTDTSALENLKYAHAIDVPLDLSNQDVHELWAEIEAKEIISSCMQILSSQAVHELWADIETRDKRVAELEALAQRLVEAGDRLSDSLCTYPEEDKTIEVMNWNAIVAEYKERER